MWGACHDNCVGFEDNFLKSVLSLPGGSQGSDSVLSGSRAWQQALEISVTVVWSLSLSLLHSPPSFLKVIFFRVRTILYLPLHYSLSHGNHACRAGLWLLMGPREGAQEPQGSSGDCSQHRANGSSWGRVGRHTEALAIAVKGFHFLFCFRFATLAFEPRILWAGQVLYHWTTSTNLKHLTPILEVMGKAFKTSKWKKLLVFTLIFSRDRDRGIDSLVT